MTVIPFWLWATILVSLGTKFLRASPGGHFTSLPLDPSSSQHALLRKACKGFNISWVGFAGRIFYTFYFPSSSEMQVPCGYTTTHLFHAWQQGNHSNRNTFTPMSWLPVACSDHLYTGVPSLLSCKIGHLVLEHQNGLTTGNLRGIHEFLV